ncbi:hypothetical protein E8D34_11535 [Nocardioides sp. GY 10113]|uniref:hypothetical protein n=1 Tax=Nocardioides sp. GY 10113 TaxID=2569761 RepID=UPI0010A7E5E6|nr:hypothetical protein [Nocardioides sp. GY 10113]TIC86301.1 hypothetical protein E8D34_11535 [Nocardioides sp. GY 10113]
MRILLALGALLLGVGVAVCTVLLHSYWWGMALGLAATAATLVALPGGWGRAPFGAAWAVVTFVLSMSRAEGDFLVSGDLSGYLLLAAVPAVLVAGLVGLRRRQDPAAQDGVGPPLARP